VFARVKESRQGEYLQIVENYREGGKVRQRLVLYVGHYRSIAEALGSMPRNLAALRRRATAAERTAGQLPENHDAQDRARALREEAEHFAQRLETLRRLVDEDPDLLDRDRGRAARHDRRRREAIAKRRGARRMAS
jgi:hypothetical protein